MTSHKIVISINSAWNIFNFRRDLVIALREAGHHVIALAPEDAYSAALVELGAEFVPIAIDQSGISPFADLLLLARYRSALGRIRPDLFLGYTIKPNIYGSLAAHSLGIPVINNISGLGTAFIRGGVLAHIAIILYRTALRRSSTVFFQNGEDRALFLAKRIVQTHQAKLLPGSGIDCDRFQPLPPRPDDGSVRFLLIGRMLRDKGVGEFVAAARHVRAQYPFSRFTLLGAAGAANRSSISLGQIEAWQREGVIDYLPECDDVRPHLAAADCVVLPSYREGLPRTLLEAAAMAKPLIATDVPGCRDIVRHEENGLLCTVQDADALAQTMIGMIECGAQRRTQMGAAGRGIAEREFDKQIVIDRYMAAIRETLATGRRGMPT